MLSHCLACIMKKFLFSVDDFIISATSEEKMFFK